MRVASRIVAGFLIALAVIVGLSVLSYRNTERQIEAQEWVTHTHRVIENLGEVLATLFGAETAQRGFVLTGDERYLQPYDAAGRRISQLLSAVGELTKDNPAQQHRLEHLRALAVAKLSELDETIGLRRKGGEAAALPVIVSGRGARVMDEARAVVGQMEDVERRLLDERRQQAAASARGMTITVVAAGPLLVVALAIAVLLVTGGMTEGLRRQTDDLGQQNDELAQQSEELSQQSEELSRQNEELQEQAEEIGALNLELGRRENLLQSLLDSARLSASEEAALHDVCVAAFDMLGASADAVVVYEKQSNRLVVRTTAGLPAETPESVPAQHRFAELVVEQNRTASLNDGALRPDLSILAVPGQPAFQAVLAAPMQANGRAFGAVAIYSRQPVEWTAEQFRLADWLAGQCGRILEILRLQSDLRRLATQLFDRAAEVQALTDAAPVAVWLAHDPECRRITGNDYADRLLAAPKRGNISRSATPGETPAAYDVFRNGRRLEAAELPAQMAASTGQPVMDQEVQLRFPDGRSVDMILNAVPLFDAERNVRGSLTAGIDITARKRTEETLRQSENRYSQLFENLLDGFAYCRMLFDDEHRPCDFVYERVNQAFERLTGLRNVVGRRVTEIIPGIRESNPDVFDIYGRVVTTGQPEEFETYLEPLKMSLSIAVYRPEPDHFVAVFDNITERTRALDALRESDRRKSEFLATLSHELRNPLAPIRYALELLRCEGDDGSPAHPKRVIERQLGHMVHLVDDLLDVTRIASNKVRLRRQRVNLRDVVEHAVEATAPDIEAAGHSLVLSLPEDPLWLDADPDRLAQVLTNLLNNAAHYTPRGGRLALAGAAEDDDVVISVSDTGIGLKPEDRDRVFEMFTQVGDPGHGGLGIGLALVRGLVELHGGRIEARSDGPGRGSDFIVRLPAAAAPARDRNNAAGAPEPGMGRRVLVVDDNVDSADMMKTFLELHGHEVCVAHDAASALAALQNFAPDIGLFDIGLPDMSGYELARRIRADARGERMFLVAVTGWGQDEDRQRARECGFNAHLTKPADPEELRQVIAGVSR